MPRIIKSGLIQMSLPKTEGEGTIEEIKEAMLQKHIPLIEEAGEKGVQIFACRKFSIRHISVPGRIKHGMHLRKLFRAQPQSRLAEYAKKYKMVIIVPVYEKEQAGVLYNTAAVIDADGTYLGKYRKNHIPHTCGFWEKFFFKPGNLGYPVFQTKYAKVGVYICYDRHFPDGARCLGLNGAEIVYNPSATVAGLSQYLWKLEQPAHAAANGYFMGCINRVGEEKPWNLGKFYGTSYFVDPRGQIFAQASEDKDELLIAEFDLDMIEEVRSTWQFFRDRRPETYGPLVATLIRLTFRKDKIIDQKIKYRCYST